ncbi:CPBP family intramembrane glutamic endopeptidase [Homoserinibacter sp. GY 40078]|uniref:CPBP family intramembrane glutamic endopeptidase n=1 Tax=Homoserinibacter sp. GY 40078 TaxID=2603275 RepID=UPI0011CA2061|nr:CPBP family intramembrane glutamic endopeptidase [Homoserinibacter sp. GY 40078]TXK17362.1 CPBP family intramembrane metalloprotease [Homoserinibacter sp. GY 40078]
MSYPPPPGFAAPIVPVAPEPIPPTPYHRMFRTVRGYAAWRPLVAVVLFAVFAGVALTIVSVLWLVVAILTGALDLTGDLGSLESDLVAQTTDVANPLSLALLMLSLVVLLPLVPAAMWCAGLRPVRVRHSVAGRLRWGWMARCLVPAVVVTAVATGLPYLFVLIAGETVEPVPVDGGLFALLAVMIIVLVPLQAAAEEYVFRGLILQVMGAWLRWSWIGVVVSTLIFTVGHTQYELWGALSVAVMGAGFAIVTIRTGGLEAAIVLHVVNNLVALLLLASGITGTTQMSSEGSGPLAPILQVVFTTGYVLWVDRLAARRGIARLTA